MTNNLLRRYGRALRGARVHDHAPCARWQTSTFLAALRVTGLTAPGVFDGAIDGASFLAYIEPSQSGVAHGVGEGVGLLLIDASGGQRAGDGVRIDASGGQRAGDGVRIEHGVLQSAQSSAVILPRAYRSMIPRSNTPHGQPRGQTRALFHEPQL